MTGGVVDSLGTENGASRLFARRADTGALVWKRPLPGQLTGAWRLSDGVRRWTFGTIAYGDPTVAGGRLYVPAFTTAGDQPFVLLDQFAPGAGAPEAIR